MPDGSGNGSVLAATVVAPPLSRNPARAVQRPAFLIERPLVAAHFTRRSRQLIVTFDNLSSVGQTNPAQPWLAGRGARAGVSVLGLIARRKDWYRNADTPALIEALREAGLFAQFDRVTLMGASMGGFAALTYAGLVPGAHVLAFSPQSTLAPALVPFERRYRYAQKTWDWATPAFLDAAEGARAAASVTLVYDPFEPADRAHAARLDGPNVRHIHADHLGHRAIRVMKETGALDPLIDGMARGEFDPLACARAARGRRANLFWQRSLLGEAERRGHLRLAHAAAERLVQLDPDQRHSRRAAARLGAMTARTAPAVPQVIEETTHVLDGAPRPPFAGTILRLPGAIVVPERAGDTSLASGVLRADQSWVELSRAWIRARKATPAPALRPGETVAHLPGRWLFGGHFRGHFGHFLVESTARLWAIDHVKGRLDGILYLPYRGQVGPVEQAMAGHAGFFAALGIDLPLKTVGQPTRVDDLILPELGFGWEDRFAGSPAYRAFMMSRLSAAAAPEGGEKLYISRARLPAVRGGVLGETVIEENLARAGFEIFHPERHPIATQIARYRAARTVVALDGSALHLAAYLLPREARIAMILRRSRANAADYIRQYRGFLGITPHVIDVIRHDWVAAGAARVDFRSIGELDFPALFRALADQGFLPSGFRPDLPCVEDLRAMLASYEDRRGAPFRILAAGEQHPEAGTDATKDAA
jgi:capsular polysaccharide biosynthesis protein